MDLVTRRVASALWLGLVTSCFSPMGNGDADPSTDTGSSAGDPGSASEPADTTGPTGEGPTGEGPTTAVNTDSSAPTGSGTDDPDTGMTTMVPESCGDGQQNGDETDLDCGGSCPPCAAELGCMENGDCVSMACLNETCVGDPECLDASGCQANVCMQATCVDFVCGEAADDMMACDDGLVCTQDEGCMGGVCEASTPKPIALVDVPDDPSLGLYFDGVGQADTTGVQVGSAGDFNGDAVPDLFVVSRKGNHPGPRVHLIYGGDTLASATLAGIEAGVGGVFIDVPVSPDSIAVAGAGDVDMDGHDDLVIGTPTNIVANNRGGAYVIFGREASDPIKLNEAPPKVVLIYGPTQTPGSAFGTAVAGLGDVDKDGFADFAVTAPAFQVDMVAAGAVFMISGAGGLPIDTIENYVVTNRAYRISGPPTSLGLGASVAGIGDFNKDGRNDVAIGQPNWNTGRGRVFVLYAPMMPASVKLGESLTDSQGLVLTGKSLLMNSALGTRLASAGDFNQDNIGDFIVGGGPGLRKAMVVYGGGGGTELDANMLVVSERGSVITTLLPEAFAIGGGEDVNGDLIDDVVVGSPLVMPSGQAYVLFGRKQAVTADVLDLAVGKGGMAIAGPGSGSAAGTAVALVPSVNADAFADVFVGATGFDVLPGNNEGRAYVVHGGKCEG